MMMRENRAKQFMPFDAMKGLAEALRDREERHSRVPKHGISEEAREELFAALVKAEKGSKVFLRYYADFHDREAEGRITELNRPYGFLRIQKTGSNAEEKICFDDLYALRLV